MKKDVASVKHKHEKMTWWSWDCYCDRCGKHFQTKAIQSSVKPDIVETDFCCECLRFFLDNNIAYREACKQYEH